MLPWGPPEISPSDRIDPMSAFVAWMTGVGKYHLHRFGVKPPVDAQFVGFGLVQRGGG